MTDLTTFTFEIEGTGVDLIAHDEFALPGRRLRLDFGHFCVALEGPDAARATALVDAERYCRTLHGRYPGGLLRLVRENSSPGIAQIGPAPHQGPSLWRAVGETREMLIEQAAVENRARPIADQALRTSYRSLQLAREQYRNNLRAARGDDGRVAFHVFMAVESLLKTGFQGRTRGNGRRVKQMCNERRHAPTNGDPEAAPLTTDEQHEVIEGAALLIRQYESHLGICTDGADES